MEHWSFVLELVKAALADISWLNDIVMFAATLGRARTAWKGRSLPGPGDVEPEAPATEGGFSTVLPCGTVLHVLPPKEWTAAQKARKVGRAIEALSRDL